MRNARERDAAAGARRRCVEDFGTTFAKHGLSMTFGRLFGLLLVSDEPIGLDEIAGELELSKSAASRAVRDLEQFGLARRISTRGSRRVAFAIAGDPADGVIVAAVARLRDLRDLFESSSRRLGETEAARRLATMADLYDAVWKANETMLDEWRRAHR